jgi:predicted nucleic acid-binding protein
VRRRDFADVAFRNLVVQPITLEIAQLAGRIEGEQAAKGIAIPFEDLIIGATALHLGFDVATHNVKHFQLIPSLNVVTI